MFDLRDRTEPGNLREMPSRPRPVTNLGRIFGQFTQLQQQLGEQVCALEESVGSQRESLAADLPELRQKINHLIAGLHDQARNDEEIRERLSRNETDVAALQTQVRALAGANAQWRSTVDQFIELLVKARAAGQVSE
jgi:septal ring factor EnvC (AmiA/AmiB activator)